MRHVNIMVFTRWGMIVVMLLAPVVLGCNARTESASEPNAVEPVAAPPMQPAAAEASTPPVDDGSLERHAAEVPPSRPLSDADLVRETFGTDAPAEVFEEPDVAAVEPDETERPRSLFRSIGRALQKGVTDAAGLTSDTSQEAAPPVASEPN